MTTLAQDYLSEYEEHSNTIKTLQNLAKSRGSNGRAGDLSPTEREAITNARERMTQLKELIKISAGEVEIDDETREKLLRAGTPRVSAPHYRSAGELLHDALHAGVDVSARERIAKLQQAAKRRDAQHMGTSTAATTATAGGFGGVTVDPVFGTYIDVLPKGQPFVSTVGKTLAPSAVTFRRPRIKDPNFKTRAATPQTAEKAELTSQAFEILSSNVDMGTYATYLNISHQLLAEHANSLDVIVDEMMQSVAWAEEAAAIAELYDSDAEIALAPSGVDADAVQKALMDAAALVLVNTGAPPEWIAYGPTGWARLGSLVDDVHRPLFPLLGAQNALGTGSLRDPIGPLGLTPILTRAITTGDIWMGNSRSIELYYYPIPMLTADEPSVLGKQVAVGELFGAFRPITDEVSNPVEGNGAVRIGIVAE